MSFDRIRPQGNWVVGPIDPDEMEAIDAARPDMIDGGAGGSWSPSSPIVIGGAGMEIHGIARLEGGANVEGGISFANGDVVVNSTSDLVVAGAITHTGSGDQKASFGQVNIGDGLTVSSGGIYVPGTGLVAQFGDDVQVQGDLDVFGGADIDGNFVVDGKGTIGGDLDVTGTVDVGGQVLADGHSVFGAGVSLDGTSFLAGPMDLINDGRIRYRTKKIVENSQTVSVEDADIFYTTDEWKFDRNITLADASEGETMEFYYFNQNSPGNLLFFREGGSQITHDIGGQFPVKLGSINNKARFVVVAGEWQLSHWDGEPS